MKPLVFIFSSCIFFSVNYKAQYFTKITTGPLVTSSGDSRSVNWVDINNDGFMDCMITNGPSGGQNNKVYLNTGTGGFTSITNDTIVKDNKPSDGATWADMNNDGDMDCFVANWYNVNNMLYANNGSGAFTQISSGPMVNEFGYSETAAWGDYDNDGLVDLYVTNSWGVKKNFLYHNSGNSTFTKILVGTHVNDANESRSVNWTDIDNDNDLDLFVTNETNQNENIYRNDGGGIFTKLTTGPLLNNLGNTMSGSWGDYDNDGDLDVFLANDGSTNSLFRNDGNFNFTKIINDTVVKSIGHSFSSSWSDIDNDGDIDLFVTNAFNTALKQLNFFYLNNGNGSFTRNGTDIIAMDSTWAFGCAFGDYDNDGFEDLAVATTRFANLDRPDLLYHNNGNSNKWITIQLIGTQANKAAIGTKIKVKAIINGNPVWQMREISAQNAYCSQNDIRAHFGLGDATQIDSIKVEWMPGTIETLTNISTNQFLTITQSVSTVGLQEKISSDEIIIYPNPSTDKIAVKLNGNKFSKGTVVTVADILGRKVMEQIITESLDEVTLNLKTIQPGSYFLDIRTDSKTITRKIIIN
jgi:hypothetical protein